jgi:hypothetical protein
MRRLIIGLMVVALFVAVLAPFIAIFVGAVDEEIFGYLERRAIRTRFAGLPGLQILSLKGDNDVGIRAVIRDTHEREIEFDGMTRESFGHVDHLWVRTVGPMSVWQIGCTLPPGHSWMIGADVGPHGDFSFLLPGASGIADVFARYQTLVNALTALPKCPSSIEVSGYRGLRGRYCVGPPPGDSVDTRSSLWPSLDCPGMAARNAG